MLLVGSMLVGLLFAACGETEGVNPPGNGDHAMAGGGNESSSTLDESKYDRCLELRSYMTKEARDSCPTQALGEKWAEYAVCLSVDPDILIESLDEWLIAEVEVRSGEDRERCFNEVFPDQGSSVAGAKDEYVRCTFFRTGGEYAGICPTQEVGEKEVEYRECLGLDPDSHYLDINDQVIFRSDISEDEAERCWIEVYGELPRPFSEEEAIATCQEDPDAPGAVYEDDAGEQHVLECADVR